MNATPSLKGSSAPWRRGSITFSIAQQYVDEVTLG